MDDETTGFWTVALGAATASGTWDGFRISPVRRTAELHVDGALTVGAEQLSASGDYALVLSHPRLGRDRVLVAGKGGTIEFGHDVVELLAHHEQADVADASEASGTAAESAQLWLTDLATGATSERCELPRVPRGM
jgi:hypothetical protein